MRVERWGSLDDADNDVAALASERKLPQRPSTASGRTQCGRTKAYPVVSSDPPLSWP